MSSTRERASAAGASFASLDDGLLTRILGCLHFSERLRVATVHKRWSRCVASPELLRTIDVRFAVREGQPLTALHAVRSWAGWMLRHAAHVRQLKLSLSNGALSYEEAPGLIATGLAACGMVAALERLDIEWESNDRDLFVDVWASALTRLQWLKVEASTPLILTANLASLHSLRSLWLGGYSIELEPGIRLPTSLENLKLEGSSSELLLQVAQLPRLSALVFYNSDMAAAAYSPLTALKSLRWLDFSGCRHFPPCLSQLTWLEALVLDGSFHAGAGDDDNDDVAGQVEPDEVVVQRVEGALRQLTGLTRLLLSDSPRGAPLSHAVASLSRLQRCSIGTFSGAAGADAEALPEGPWAGSLLSLGANFGALLLSQPLLSAAQQLEQVCILGPPVSATGQEQADAFWGWARRHPSLKRLTFDLSRSENPVPSSVFINALRLQRERPLLCIEGVKFYGASFYDEFFEVEPL